jgi:hypothetical protein
LEGRRKKPLGLFRSFNLLLLISFTGKAAKYKWITNFKMYFENKILHLKLFGLKHVQLRRNTVRSSLSSGFRDYIIKEFVQAKMSFTSREFLIWKERGRGWERQRGGQAGQPASIFKVRLGVGEIEEIEESIP